MKKFKAKKNLFAILGIVCIIGIIGISGCQTASRKQLNFIKGDIGACIDNQAIISKAQANVKERLDKIVLKQAELEKRIQCLEDRMR